MSDDALIHQFSRDRCETAFAALVRRHLQLVFATALRQTGDHQLAEEIAQNVFLALARKAGRLGGHHTVAGWLHQATLKEARLALRTRMRRQQREQVAIDIGHLHPNDSNAELAGLLPLLDEALANLREPERLAVILRFLEEKSWKEVGDLLGVTEDAARKKAERALDGLGQFFARHGFKVSAATLTTGMTSQAGAAVPITLAATVTQAAVANTAAATTTGILLGHLMNLTKTQTTIATLLVCAAPIAYEANALRNSDADLHPLHARLAEARSELENARLLNQSLETELASLDQTMAMLQAPMPALPIVVQGLPTPVENPKPAGWREDLPYVEFPKDALKELKVTPIKPDGRVTEELADVLALTREEVAAVENVVTTQLKAWQGLESASGRYEFDHVRRTQQQPDYPETFTMRFPALPEQGGKIIKDLESQIRSTLGNERGDLFFKYAENWVDHRFNSGGSKERLITLTRRTNPSGSINVNTDFFRDGNYQGSASYGLWTSANDRTPTSLQSLPVPLKIIATQWHLNDRPR